MNTLKMRKVWKSHANLYLHKRSRQLKLMIIYYIRLYSYIEKPMCHSCLVFQQRACTTHTQLVPIRSHIIASATGSVPPIKVKESLHRGMGMEGSFPNLGESKCWNKRMVNIKSMSCLGYCFLLSSFEKLWGGSTTAGELSCSVAWRALLDGFLPILQPASG